MAATFACGCGSGRYRLRSHSAHDQQHHQLRQEQAVSAGRRLSLSCCGGCRYSRAAASDAMSSSIAPSPSFVVTAAAAAPRRPLVVDWHLQRDAQGSTLVCGYVYKCTGFKVLPSAALMGAVFIDTDGVAYDLLQPVCDLRTGALASSADLANGEPPTTRSCSCARRNKSAVPPRRRSSSDDRDTIVRGAGSRTACSCSHRGLVDLPRPWLASAAAGCFAPAAAAAASAGAAAAAAFASGQHCEPSSMNSGQCVNVHPLPPAAASSARAVTTTTAGAAAASERSWPYLRPPSPFDDVNATHLHMAGADEKPDTSSGVTARPQKLLTDITLALRPPSLKFSTVAAPDCQTLASRHQTDSRHAASGEIAMAEALPFADKVQSEQPLEGRAAKRAAGCNNLLVEASVASDQTINGRAAAATDRLTTEFGQQPNVAAALLPPPSWTESGQQPNIAAALLPPPSSTWLPRSHAQQSSKAAQAVTAPAASYGCAPPAAAILTATVIPHRTEQQQSSASSTATALAAPGISNRVLRSSSVRHTDTSASSTDRNLCTAARSSALSGDSISTSASTSELSTLCAMSNNCAFRNSGPTAAAPAAPAVEYSARRKRNSPKPLSSEHSLHGRKRLRLTTAKAADERLKDGYSNRLHRLLARRESSPALTGAEQTRASVRANGRHVRRSAVDTCENVPRYTTDSDDVSYAVSSWRSRQQGKTRGRKPKPTSPRLRSVGSPPQEDREAHSQRKTIRGGGRVGPRQQQDAALGFCKVTTGVTVHVGASRNQRHCGTVHSAAYSTSIRSPSRSDSIAAERRARSSSESGISLRALHTLITSNGSSAGRATANNAKSVKSAIVSDGSGAGSVKASNGSNSESSIAINGNSAGSATVTNGKCAGSATARSSGHRTPRVQEPRDSASAASSHARDVHCEQPARKSPAVTARCTKPKTKSYVANDPMRRGQPRVHSSTSTSQKPLCSAGRIMHNARSGACR